MRTYRFQLFGLLICFFLLLSGSAFGDGKMFPLTGAKAKPGIPQQRAIISYHNGVENLTIETSVNAKGQELGWVIPLPAAPTAMAKVSPGAFRALDLAFHPKVFIHGSFLTLIPMVILGLLLGVWVLLGYFDLWVHPHLISKKLFERFLWFYGLLIFFVVLCNPRIFGVPGSAMFGQEAVVLNSMRVGNYDITILGNASSGDLEHWLSANGYESMSAADSSVIAAYAADNWVLAAIKLVREAEGLTTPHPIRFTFPSPRAVYPLKLTGSEATGPLALELFVFGDKQASLEQMTVEIADQVDFHYATSGETNPDGSWKEEKIRYLAYLKNSGLEFGHQGLLSRIKPNSVFTRLSGVFSPKQMSNDLYLGWEELEPYKKTYYSHWEAILRVSEFSLLVSYILVFIGTLVHIGFPKLIRSRWSFLKTLVLPIGVVCLISSTVIYVALDKVDVGPEKRVGINYSATGLPWEIEAELGDKRSELRELDIPQLESHLEKLFANEVFQSPYSGRKPMLGDSPGDYFVKKRGKGWRLYFYNMIGQTICVTSSKVQ